MLSMNAIRQKASVAFVLSHFQRSHLHTVIVRDHSFIVYTKSVEMKNDGVQNRK